MNEFVASNGYAVVINGASIAVDSSLESAQRFAYRGGAGCYFLDMNGLAALREFFLAERDAELGRWRSKEHPEYVVIGKPSGGPVAVVNERTLVAMYRRRNSSGDNTLTSVAREFFAAHPEPKPWHDAQHGEFWALTTTGVGERLYRVVRTEEAGFRFFLEGVQSYRPGLFPDEAQITAGRRIWPEVSA